MPRNTQFQEKWLSEKDQNGHKIEMWCSKHSSSEATCFLCKKTFSIQNSGIKQIHQHANTSKHRTLAETALSERQTKIAMTLSQSGQMSACLVSSSGTIGWNMNAADKVSYAELLWTMKVVKDGYSFNSCKNLKDVFCKMFPDSEISKSFTLGPSKVAYEVSYGLGPYFHKQLISSVKKSDSYFSLSFDETTTEAGKKQLDIHIRYWDSEEEKIICHFLCCFQLGHATAIILKEKLLLSLSKNKLPHNRLLAIGSDGPPVNLKCLKDIDSLLKDEGLPGLINIGTCNLHVIHNSFRHGMIKILSHWEIEDFLDAIYKFFHKYPSRCEDFQSIQEDLEMKKQQLLRYVNNRWLSIVPVISVILTQWAALEKYFLHYIPKNSKSQCHSKLYQKIISHLKDPLTVIHLYFLKSVGETFDKFLLLVQKEEPLIHILYDEICTVIRSLGCRIVKQEVFENMVGKKLKTFDFKDRENHLPMCDIDVGICAKKEALKLKEKDSKLFFNEAKNFISAVIEYLLSKVPLSNKLLENIQCLHPLVKTDPKTLKCIARVAKEMPLVIQENDIDKLCDEWKLYMVEYIDDTFTETRESRTEVMDEYEEIEQPASSPIRIDLYWGSIFKKKNSMGGVKYPLISRIVKAALSLFHGQADVERGFSHNSLFLNSNRSLLNETSINGLRTVQSAINHKDICSIPATPLCLQYFREAHNKYKTFLKECKAKNDKQQGKRTIQSEVDDMEKRVKRLKDLIKTSHSIIGEANERLSRGLKIKDMKEISTAHALLDSGHRELVNNTEELKNAEKTLFSLTKKAK